MIAGGLHKSPAKVQYLDAWWLNDRMEYERLKRTDPAAAQALWGANDANNRALGLKAAEAAEKENAAKSKMEALWNNSPPVHPDHPYLKKLGIKPCGARLHNGRLVIRMRDDAGNIDSLVFIDGESGKETIKPIGSSSGFFMIGDMADTDEMYIAMSFTSGAIIHAATGGLVMVMNNPNLIYDMAWHARMEYNPLNLILCPEPLVDDVNTLLLLREAACAADAEAGGEIVDAMLAILPEGVNSYCELAQHYGLKAVLSCVGQPVSLSGNWRSGCEDPATPESWSGFQQLVASWRARASKLAIPQEETRPDRQPRRYPLLTAAALSETPLAQYRVKNVLPREGIAAIFGPPGVAKSFLALDLAFAVSDSRAWSGYRVAQCDVLYLCLEGQGGLAQRVQAYRERHGQDTGKQIRFITAPFSLLYHDDVNALVDTIKDAGIRGGVIMIDTLSAASAGADENSSVDMGRILEALKRIREECGGLVILVHHSGKDATKGLRGHSSLLAALDAVMEVRRDDDRRSWRLAKSKDGLDGEEHAFRLSIVELDTDDDGDPITSCAIEPEERAADSVRRVKLPKGGNQKTVYDVAGELLRKSIHFGKGGAPAERPCIRLDDLIAACRGRLAVEEDRIPERVRLAVTGLINNGCIILREDWLRDP